MDELRGAGRLSARLSEYTQRRDLAGSKEARPRILYPQVLSLRVGEEQLPARVVPMRRDEGRATLGPGTWGVGLVYLGSPEVLTLLTLSGSSVGTQGLP